MYVHYYALIYINMHLTLTRCSSLYPIIVQLLANICIYIYIYMCVCVCVCVYGVSDVIALEHV
jgi:hypothetical protein